MSSKIKTELRPLSELKPGDCVKTAEGRPQWFRIEEIGPLSNQDEAGYQRGALVCWLGGKDAGRRQWLTLFSYAKRYEVAAEPFDVPDKIKRTQAQADILGKLIGDQGAVSWTSAGVVLTPDQADALIELAERGTRR